MTQCATNKTNIQKEKITEESKPLCGDRLITDIEKLLDGIRLESAINILKIVSLRLKIQCDEAPQNPFQPQVVRTKAE